MAAKSDVIVAALGETSEMSGESSCRTNLEMTDTQRILLQELLKTGKPVVLVLFTGRPLVPVSYTHLIQAKQCAKAQIS